MLHYSHTFNQTGIHSYRRLWMAADRSAQVTEHDALFDRALLNVGRVNYWWAREVGHDEFFPYLKRDSERCFGPLAKRQASSRVVRMYGGKEIPWGRSPGAEEIRDLPVSFRTNASFRLTSHLPPVRILERERA